MEDITDRGASKKELDAVRKRLRKKKHDARKIEKSAQEDIRIGTTGKSKARNGR